MKLLSQFLRVGDGCRKENELRSAAIEAANPLEAPKHLGHVAPKNTAIGMHFIHNHETQLLPEELPIWRGKAAERNGACPDW